MTVDVGKSTKPPFFIVGAHRSGTTMLRLMLNNHPNIAVPHESGFITEIYKNLGNRIDLSEVTVKRGLLAEVARHPHVEKGQLITDPEAILRKEITTYRDLVASIFGVYAETQGKLRWGDKTPTYTDDVDIIRAIFPDCKILHLVRDGRDVVVSQRRLSWMSNNLPKLARDWAWKVTLAHKVGSVLGPDFLEVRYEDLVRNPEETLEKICEFLEEPFFPEILDFAQHAKSIVPNDSLQWHRNSIRPPDPEKLGQWRKELSRADRVIFEHEAGSALELFGYEREHLDSNWSSRLLKLYYLLFRRS